MTSSYRFLAVGAHVGDAELMAGPFMCETALVGNKCELLALTSGERGNPNVEAETYKSQKIEEANSFSKKSGIPYTVYSDIPDTKLTSSSEVISRVINLIIDGEYTHVLTHWRGSFHPDHRQAHEIVSSAVFQINLNRIAAHQINLFYCENWEDKDGFTPNEYFPISQKGYELWNRSIEHERFIYGEFSKFRYLDYYTALLKLQGCLSNNNLAVAMMRETNF